MIVTAIPWSGGVWRTYFIQISMKDLHLSKWYSSKLVFLKIYQWVFFFPHDLEGMHFSNATFKGTSKYYVWRPTLFHRTWPDLWLKKVFHIATSFRFPYLVLRFHSLALTSTTYHMGFCGWGVNTVRIFIGQKQNKVGIIVYGNIYVFFRLSCNF